MNFFRASNRFIRVSGILALNFILILSFLSGALATTARFSNHFDDEIIVVQKRVCDNTYFDMQNLRVNFSMGEGRCLIRGVNYSYDNTGSGPTHSVLLRFQGDSNFVDYSDNSITHVSSVSWRLFNLTGPTYLLDDDPAITFIGTQASDNCILLSGDIPSHGFSYYNTGSGWTLDSYEYLVKLVYEWIIKLNLATPAAGSITNSDNIDAYFVNLTAGIPYMFMLDRVSGTGNLTMRLVANQELTNNILATSINMNDPAYMSYKPSSNATVVLLVEAENAMSDTANYNIAYYIDKSPTSNKPDDITTLKSGTETINWYLKDEYGGGSYHILVNSTPSTWKMWINNTNLQYPIDRSAPGKYNYTIVYNDTGGNWGTPDTVIVNILDSPPTSNHPTDIKTAVGSSRTIPWILKDDFGAGYYRVFINASPGQWQPWINNSNLNYPINTTLAGTFNHVIQYNDTPGGNLGISDSVIVTIKVDTVAPTSNQPANIITNKYGLEKIGWVLRDEFEPGSYQVLVNHSPSILSFWINNTNLQYPINRSAPGVFNYTLAYCDTGNNWGVPSTVFVTIADNPPSSNHPTDILTSTTSTATISWNLTDDYGAGRYRVLVNSTPSAWQSWISSNLLNYPVNTTIAGRYNYTIQYNDSKSQWGIPDTVLVTVLLDTPPKSNQPANIITYMGYSRSINWILTDDKGAGYYRVLINGKAKSWAPWINKTSVNYPINTTIQGEFNYTIQYNDSAGQAGIPDTVIVTISIDNPPKSNQPSDITTYVGYSRTINWILTDDVGAGYYRVSVNGTPSQWKAWTNNTAVNYPINTTKQRTLIYSISYNDSFGQLGVPDTVQVTILLDNPPQSTHPADIVTTKGYVRYIGWTLTDDVGAGYYRVLINSTPKPWSPWTNGIPVNYPINTSKAGTFIYIIQYNDSIGQLGVPDTVNVIVNNPPPLPTSQTRINLTCFLNGNVTVKEKSFSIPVEGWNSTYIAMNLSKVNLYKYYFPIEADYEIGLQGYRYPINTQTWVMGFNVTDSCIIDKLDFVFTTGTQAILYINVIIYNATYDPIVGNLIPHKVIYNETEGKGLNMRPWPLMTWVSASVAPYWNGTLTKKAQLFVNHTKGNTFFVSFNTSRSLYWHYSNDDATDPDDGLVYQGQGVLWHNQTTDATLRLNLSPLKTTQEPSKINMTINSKSVSQARTWNYSRLLVPLPSGSILFNISCTWYNCSFQVNWTTHLQKLSTAVTTALVEPSNAIVTWNVTIPAVFITKSYHNRINVTIPITWNATKVYYYSSEYSSSFWYEVIKNAQKQVIIRETNNGMWIVICKGYNWISGITIPKEPVYILDSIKVSTSLIHSVYDTQDKTAQLTVTDALQKNLDVITGRGNGKFINITWNISQSIHTNGKYSLVVSWFNGTEAGAWNTTVTIFNSTSLVILSPEHRGTIIEVSRGEMFNLTLLYNMSYWIGKWDTLYLKETFGARVTYTFQSAVQQPMTSLYIGKWVWTVTISAPAMYGSYLIYVNATAWGKVQNYTNFEITLRVKQYGTNLVFNDTAAENSWKKPIAFTFRYTNFTNAPIYTQDITINWKYESGTIYSGLLLRGFNYSVFYNGGTGVYTITFANFSAFRYNLLFVIDSDIYESQEAYLTLIFTNLTTSLTNQTNIPRTVYKQYGIVNVTLFYRDLLNNVGVAGGVIQSNWSSVKSYTVQDLGTGYYRVSFNISKVFLNNYSILLRASKPNYQTASLVIRLEIYGYPTIITNIIGANLTGVYARIYAMDNWTIRFNYNNLTNGQGISGATVTANFGGHSCVWQNVIGGNYTIWADSSKLNAPMAEQNYTLQIQIRKSLYEQQILTITVNIRKLPTQLVPSQSLINARIDDFIELRVQLNDTHNHLGVNGIVWYKLQSVTVQMQPTGTGGIYTATLNLTNYVPGVYQIQLNSWAMDHVNATSTITLNVSRLNVVIITEGTTISGYINNLVNITIQLKDSKNRFVENLIVTYKIEALAIQNTFIYRGNGFYDATIDLIGFSTISYQLKIETPLTSRYNNSRAILTLSVYKIPTIIIPASLNITGFYGEQYVLNMRYMEIVHNTYINSAILQFQIVGKTSPTTMAFLGAGTYQSTLNFTAIGVGDYKIKLNVSSSVTYQAYNISLDLHIRAKIQTQLLLTNPTHEIEEGSIINVTAKLQTTSFVPLRNQPIEWSTSVKFNNGSISLFQQIKYTDNSGKILFQYKVSGGASSIDIFANFAGSTNLTDVWNTTSINVLKIAYNLIIRVQSNIKVNELLIIRADLSNITHPIGNALVNFTIIVVYSGEATNETQMWGFTAINGTVVVSYMVPSDVISIYIVATYKSSQGAITNSEPKVVVAIDTWLIELGKWLPIILLIVVIIIVIIFGVAAYYKVVKPRFTSIEDRKRKLVQRRAENRREIAQITRNIQQQREDILKEADAATQILDFDKASKFYEKAGNLTLELADKAVAKEFFSKAKQIQEKSQQKERQSELKEQREKLLEAARVAIRERNVVEASRNYREVAEMSRMLGERDQADKFLKLANVANERIVALKEGDMRKRSGVFLSKADKCMGKQDFLGAAENFEEAAKIMLVLGDEEGTLRFVNWAKLARERQSVATAKSREEWVQILTQEQADLNHKAKEIIKERKYDEAMKIYITLAIYAMELGKTDLVEKYKKEADFCRKQATQVEVGPESRELIEERRKLLLNVEDAIKNNRYAVAAKYYNRIATITEIIEGKEVARNYLKQANYYASKGQEKRLTEREEEVRPIEKLPIARVAEEEGEIIKPIARVAEKEGEEIEKSKSELAVTVKQARDALKTGKPVLARDLYEKAATRAEVIKDTDSALRYKQKAEEIEIVKPKKVMEDEGAIRRKLTDLTARAEKALQKKKYAEAKNLYEEISELFLQLGEEDAANSFLERAASLKRLI
jgi:hypothetical protein